MIKTIKRVKEMRLDELIKYVWDNDIKHKTYEDVNNMELEIRFNPYGYLDSTPQNITPSDLFKVEVEEEITLVMEFENLIWFDLKGNIHISRESSIANIITFNDLCKKIYAYHNGEFIKVWEREEIE